MATQRAAWGIEVGQFALKAMRLVTDGETVSVTDFAVIPHQRVLTDPAVEDQPGMVRVTLAAFVQQHAESLAQDPIVMSLPGNAGFARFTTLPGIDPKSLRSMVEYEAKQQIPFPMEDVEWDSHVFPPDESGQCGIGIFAVTNDRLRELLSLYAECGIEPDVLTLSPIAAYNAISHDLNLSADSKVISCLDIGTASSDFIVIDRGRCWIRTFPVGGTHFTSSITDAFAKQGVNYGKAERIKLDRAPKEDLLRARTTAMRGVTAQLVDEIGRSRDFYQDGNEGAEIKTAYGVGSTLRISGLRTKIAGDLKLDLKRVEAFQRVEVHGPDAADFAAHSINLLSAYGLALQGIGMAKLEVNLTPIARVRGKVWKSKTPWFAAAAALIVLSSMMLFLRWGMDRAALSELADRSAEADTVLSQGKALVAQLEEVQRVADDHVTANVTNLLDDRGIWPHIVNDAYSALAAASPRADELSGDPKRIIAIPTTDRNLVQLQSLSGKAKFDPATNKRQIEVSVLVVLTHGEPDRHINKEDGVLGWLRANRDRPDVPYVIDEESLVVPSWTKIKNGTRETAAPTGQDVPGSGTASGGPSSSGSTSGGGKTNFGGGSFSGRKQITGTVDGPGGGGTLGGAGGETGDGGGGAGGGGSGDQGGDQGAGSGRKRRPRTQVAGVDEKLPPVDLVKDAPLPSSPMLTDKDDTIYEGLLTFTVTLRGGAAPVPAGDETSEPQ